MSIDEQKAKQIAEILEEVWNVAIEAAIQVAITERHNVEMAEEMKKLKK